MTLRAYLDQKHLSAEKLAAQLGVHHSAVYRWMSGESTPRAQLVAKIVEATGGAVTLDDLLAPSSAAQAAGGGR